MGTNLQSSHVDVGGNDKETYRLLNLTDDSEDDQFVDVVVDQAAEVGKTWKALGKVVYLSCFWFYRSIGRTKRELRT